MKFNDYFDVLSEMIDDIAGYTQRKLDENQTYIAAFNWYQGLRENKEALKQYLIEIAESIDENDVSEPDLIYRIGVQLENFNGLTQEEENKKEALLQKIDLLESVARLGFRPNPLKEEEDLPE